MQYLRNGHVPAQCVPSEGPQIAPPAGHSLVSPGRTGIDVHAAGAPPAPAPAPRPEPDVEHALNSNMEREKIRAITGFKIMMRTPFYSALCEITSYNNLFQLYAQHKHMSNR
ncbi:MAG: hypothetical protein HOB14_03855 [Gammaproteobacteria bacterium]|nr:hypothetical protein [Gammaproteobacteria bacterium]